MNDDIIKYDLKEGFDFFSKFMCLYSKAKNVDCYNFFNLNDKDIQCATISFNYAEDKGTLNVDKKLFDCIYKLLNNIILFYDNKIEVEVFKYNYEYFVVFDCNKNTIYDMRKITEKQFNDIKQFQFKQKLEKKLKEKNIKEKINKI